MGKIRAWAADQLGAEVAFVCDPDSSLAEETAAKYPGCQARSSVDDLIWEGLSAIFVCTPPHLHTDTILNSIENRIPFLVEKPIGVSRQEILPILDALKKTPVVNAVGYMNRYRESVQTVRKASEGAKILGGSANWVCGMYGVPWWSQKQMSGGPVNEQSTHVVDLARYLCGEVVTVQAIGEQRGEKWNEIDNVAFQMKFASGALFSVFYSCTAQEKMIGLRIFTDEKELRLDGWDFRLPEATSPANAVDKNQIFLTETKAFFNACKDTGDNGIVSDFADAAKTQTVVDAIQHSLLSGNSESVEY